MEIRNLGQENRGCFGIMTKYCIDGKMDCSIFFSKGILGQSITLTHFRPCENNHPNGELLHTLEVDHRVKRLLEEMLFKVVQLSNEEKNSYINVCHRANGCLMHIKNDF